MTTACCFLRSTPGFGLAVVMAAAGAALAPAAWAAEGPRWQAQAAHQRAMPQEDAATEAAMRQLSPAQRAELREQLRSEWNARHPADGGGADPAAARADGSPPRRGWNLPFPWRDPRH
ncbi:MAG: hypothetical protein J7603_09400 [Pseudacidovorax sp.]|nr:hypothetical protein [Pseudacidovorax sp.]